MPSVEAVNTLVINYRHVRSVLDSLDTESERAAEEIRGLCLEVLCAHDDVPGFTELQEKLLRLPPSRLRDAVLVMWENRRFADLVMKADDPLCNAIPQHKVYRAYWMSPWERKAYQSDLSKAYWLTPEPNGYPLIRDIALRLIDENHQLANCPDVLGAPLLGAQHAGNFPVALRLATQLLRFDQTVRAVRIGIENCIRFGLPVKALKLGRLHKDQLTNAPEQNRYVSKPHFLVAKAALQLGYKDEAFAFMVMGLQLDPWPHDQLEQLMARYLCENEVEDAALREAFGERPDLVLHIIKKLVTEAAKQPTGPAPKVITKLQTLQSAA